MSYSRRRNKIALPDKPDLRPIRVVFDSWIRRISIDALNPVFRPVSVD